MKLPCDECDSRCCCHAPFGFKDFDRVKHLIPEGSNVVNVGKAFVIYKKGSDETCAFLENNKCTIYEHRPVTCRNYGVLPTLPCAKMYPDRARYLLNKQADRLRKRPNLHPNLKAHL